MKRLAILFAFCFLSIAAGDNPYEAYISKYSGIAVKEMKRSGVPASITLAQGLLESSAGRSELAVKGNNHFGIKCHNDWSGKRVNHDAEIRNECFRAYDKAEDSFRDHSDFLRYQNRYKSLFDLDPTDYKGWASGLKAAGYATDPAYPAKLVKIIEDYGLSRFDTGVPVEVASPAVVMTPRLLAIDYQETISVSLSRPVYTQNGVPFIYAVEGETFADIAEANGFFKGELLRYNDRSSDAELEGGEYVYLSPKKKSAAPGADKYIVGVPEDVVSLWELSQRYGVRLSSLCRLNRLPADYVTEVGDVVVLRK